MTRMIRWASFFGLDSGLLPTKERKSFQHLFCPDTQKKISHQHVRVVQPETENSWPFSSLVTSSSPIQPSLSSTCRWQQEEITTDNQSGWISLSPARLACSSERCRHHWRCMPCLLGRAGHSPYLTLAPLHKKWWYMTPRTAFSALWLQGKSWNIQTRLSFLLRALKLLFLAREEKASVSFPRKKKEVSWKGKKKIKSRNATLFWSIMIEKLCFITCSFVIDQFAHFALHYGQCFPRLLLHQQPQLPEVGKREQVIHAVTLMRSTRNNVTRQDSCLTTLY